MKREEAVETLQHELEIWERICKSNHPMEDALRMAIEELEEPERAHGWWIHTGEGNVYAGHQHECSVCGYRLMVSPMCDNENYCCNCGAKMDLEEPQEENL